jgi:P-type Ca2+ transporter type 2C
MQRPPRGFTDRLIDRQMWIGIGWVGIVMAAVTLAALDLRLPGGVERSVQEWNVNYGDL